MSAYPLKIAQKHGVKVRIAHSHSKSQDKNLKYPIKLLSKHLIPKYATHLFSCGKEAGDWMFGGNAYTVLNNAIDAEKYRYDCQIRNQVRKALLDADVNYKVAKTFTDTVKEKALGQNVLTAVKPSQLMVKIVHDELTQLMGGETAEIDLEGKPAVILMSGLQGSGKTTFSGKLARMLKTKKNKKPLLVACDVYRPAAIEQLRVLAEQIGVPIYSEPDSKNPVKIAENAIQEAKAKGYDVVIVDTAGRLAVDEEMMNEIAAIKKAINPNEILFVVDSMTGQDAVNTAKEFNERLDFNGVVLTKLDGDTRGGAALSIRSVVNKPIKFVGTGEKLDAIDQFHPSRMSDRILGMGDIVSLVERAQEQYDEEEAKRLQKKIAKNQFDFNDFLSQIAQIKKMGNRAIRN